MKDKIRYIYDYLYFLYHIGFKYIKTNKFAKKEVKKVLFYCNNYAECMRRGE